MCLILYISQMARNVRLNIPGAFYHVMLRGNGKKQIFFTNGDYNRFCFLLQEGVERFGHRIHAFCLMPNHVHLLVQACEIPISKAMHNAAFRFAQYLNIRTQTVGHQFQGRFKSILVDEDEYLLHLLKYIHMNPVKANMVEKPEDYYWSSHRCYCNNERIPWIEKLYSLSLFSDELEEATIQYQKFMSDILSDRIVNEIESPKYQGLVLGNDDFIEKVTGVKSLPDKLDGLSMNELIQIICDMFDTKIDLLVGMGKCRENVLIRGLIAYYVNKSNNLTLEALAKVLNRSAPTLSKKANEIMKEKNFNSLIQGYLFSIESLIEKNRIH